MFKYVVQFAGDDKFFIGSDYPHAEGFVHPVAKAREHLKELARRIGRKDSVEKRARLLPAVKE